MVAAVSGITNDSNKVVTKRGPCENIVTIHDYYLLKLPFLLWWPEKGSMLSAAKPGAEDYSCEENILRCWVYIRPKIQALRFCNALRERLVGKPTKTFFIHHIRPMQPNISGMFGAQSVFLV